MEKNYWENYESLKLETWISNFSPEEINIEVLEEYLDFIRVAVDRYDPNRYFEWHHVMPRCVDKEESYTTEVVCINGADHFEVHLKLVDCFRGYFQYLLSCAAVRMKSHSTSPQQYELARQKFSESQTGDNNPAKRAEVRQKMSQSAKKKVFTLEHRRNIGKASIGNQYCRGRKLSEEELKAHRKRMLGNTYVKDKHWKLSEETRKKHCRENLSEESLESYRKSALGNQNALGKHWKLSEETKANMREVAKTRTYSVVCCRCERRFQSKGPAKGQLCPACKSLI